LTVPDRLLGRRVLAADDLTRPWSTEVHTFRVTVDGGLVVIWQSGAATARGRAGIARRIRFARALARTAPGLAVPEVLAGDPSADPPYLVLAFVPGVTGAELLETPGGAAVVGRVAGETVAPLAAIDPAAVRARLPRTWADASRLAAAAERWLDEARRHLDDAGTRACAAVIERIPALFAPPPVLAHGDLAPVNLVVADARLAGLLDLERLRVAPAGFDAAWFRLLVRHHHPERWADAGPPFLAAAGLADDHSTRRRLDDLAVLACLEMVAGLPRRGPGRVAWVVRAAEVLGGRLPGP
jgi:aminoglycoside phosphotransferase (APT) family kinase protein